MSGGIASSPFSRSSRHDTRDLRDQAASYGDSLRLDVVDSKRVIRSCGT